MRKIIQGLSLLTISFGASAQSIPFVYEYNIEDYKGKTYLSFMEEVVKPAMDAVASEGYEVKGGDAMEEAYLLSDTKVQRKVERSWGGLSNVKRIADALEGERVTLDTLPGKIRSVDRSVDSYGLATFIGLASGGGVSIKYFDDNYALNVHYDETEERSGRSFGVGPTRKANDASDKNYLEDIQEYSSENTRDLNDFYRALFESLLNTDASHYQEVVDEGQTVLTDFLAVFTAEQARNLMDGSVRPHWDAALLEVTLLASFHAGQDEFRLFYKNPATGELSFTNETMKQTPCEVPTRTQTAAMRDYWQFSRNIENPQHCKRSGINITKSEFRKLGQIITSYTAENNPELFEELQGALKLRRTPRNLYEELSKFLINTEAPRRMTRDAVGGMSDAWLKFLEYGRTEANNISEEILAN